MTLVDVAKRARLSVATVSRVVNKGGLIREATRARVRKAIEELKYHPNIHARPLAGSKSRTLGMIVSEMEPSLIWDLLESEVPVIFYDVSVPACNNWNIEVNYQ